MTNQIQNSNMNKSSIILKYFQKVHLLTVDNPDYCRTISSLFEWLTENDRIKNDRTTRLLLCHPRPDRGSFKIPAGVYPVDSRFRGNDNGAGTVKIISRQNLIIAGLEEIAYLLKKYTHLSLRLKCKDSQSVNKDQVIAEIIGSTSEILAYERTVLNILQRMSGIATETKNIMQVIAKHGKIFADRILSERIRVSWKEEGFVSSELRSKKILVCEQLPMIAATRKTPWMALDKKAVAAGGGLTHRLDLSDGILIKDNHLQAIRTKYHLLSNQEAIRKALTIIIPQSINQLIEVETETEEETVVTISTFQQLNNNNSLAILLDNFTIAKATRTIEEIKKDYDVSNIIFEASGGITSENISKWRQTGVDFLSLGSLTHSPKAADLSIEF